MVKVMQDVVPKADGRKSEGFYMDSRLKSNVDIICTAVKEDDFDAITLIDGEEGFGKSTLGSQIGFYVASILGTTFTLNNIVFSAKDFKDKCMTLDKFNVLIWDEARKGLNSRRAMTELNNTIVDMLAEIRQRNLFVIIIMPTFMDMDKNVAVWRSKFLLHVYGNGFKRGYYDFYDKDKKRVLYFLGRKRYYDYKCIAPSFDKAEFKEFLPYDKKEYSYKKAKAFTEFQEAAKPVKEVEAIKQRNILLRDLWKRNREPSPKLFIGLIRKMGIDLNERVWFSIKTRVEVVPEVFDNKSSDVVNEFE